MTVAAPSRAQITVWDPTNHVQNVLQAARALQQINNQITSLTNAAQMLVNQARNLASLPYSSLQQLQQLQQSVARTQQLLQQAQRIAAARRERPADPPHTELQHCGGLGELAALSLLGLGIFAPRSAAQQRRCAPTTSVAVRR